MKKLYRYSDMAGQSGWFENPAEYRKVFPKPAHGLIVRVCHESTPPPAGYRKMNGHLADGYVSPIKRKKWKV